MNSSLLTLSTKTLNWREKGKEQAEREPAGPHYYRFSELIKELNYSISDREGGGDTFMILRGDIHLPYSMPIVSRLLGNEIASQRRRRR